MEKFQTFKSEHIIFYFLDAIEREIQDLQVGVCLTVEGASVKSINFIVLQQEMIKLAIIQF